MRPCVVIRISFSLMAAASGRGFSTRWYRSMVARFSGGLAAAAAFDVLLKGWEGEGGVSCWQ
jgi:hypothetical protein